MVNHPNHTTKGDYVKNGKRGQAPFETTNFTSSGIILITASIIVTFNSVHFGVKSLSLTLDSTEEWPRGRSWNYDLICFSREWWKEGTMEKWKSAKVEWWMRN